MIIGISAKIGCGKTTLTNMFLKKYPKYIKKSFANILKEECAYRYDYSGEWNYTEDGKAQIVNHKKLPRENMTVRDILQWHGTDFRRKQDPDYWMKRMDLLFLYPLFIIIDDCRFKNEADFVKKRSGRMIRINPYREWIPGKYAKHKSETDLDEYKRFDLILTPKFGKLKSCLSLIEKLIKER